MKYPQFLSKNSTIGVVALSAGVGDNLEGYDKSINHLKEDFNVIETANVRNLGARPASGEVRAKELDELVNNDEVDLGSDDDYIYVEHGEDERIDESGENDAETVEDEIKNRNKWKSRFFTCYRFYE